VSADPKIITLTPGMMLMGVGVLAPLIMLCVLSFLSRGSYGDVVFEFSFSNYQRLFDPLLMLPLMRSVFFAFFCSVLALIISLPTCLYVMTLSSRVRQTVMVFLILPCWVNFLVRTYGWILILGEHGVMNNLLRALGMQTQPLEILFTWKAVIIGLVYVYVPFMLLPLYSVVEKLDQKLLLAARELGASSWQVFWYVLLPLLRPGIRTGLILVAIMSCSDFIVAALLGGSKVSLIGTVIKDQFLSVRDWPFGAALSLAVILFLLLVVQVVSRVLLPPLPSERSA
jgi:spermidine/putrescine transport system permease protein